MSMFHRISAQVQVYIFKGCLSHLIVPVGEGQGLMRLAASDLGAGGMLMWRGCIGLAYFGGRATGGGGGGGISLSISA